MLDAAREHVCLQRAKFVRDSRHDERLHPLEDEPELLVRMLCRGTVASGSKRIRFSIARSPNSGCPATPAASSNARTESRRMNCGSTRSIIVVP